MQFRRSIAGRGLIVCAVLAGFAWQGPLSAGAAGAFPFEQELVLDAAPMPPVKRMPVLTISENGRATVDLWCRTVVARVQIDGEAIKIETAPLPEALPQYMSAGQCSEARVAADNEMLSALAQVTEWRKRGDDVELTAAEGASLAPLRFRASSH